MSLINDALKQAQKLEPQHRAPANGPALSPVESPRHRGGSDFLLGSLIAVILLLAGLLLWQFLRGDGGVIKVRANTLPLPTAAPAIAKAPVTPTPIAAKPVVVLAAVVAPPITNLVVAPQPAKPAGPAYKLQSIFYFAKNPSAMINGKTLQVGGHVGDARVVAITKDSATIVTSTGHTKVLELP